jgi:hypothetical protein
MTNKTLGVNSSIENNVFNFSDLLLLFIFMCTLIKIILISVRIAIRPKKPGLSLVLDFVSWCSEKYFRDVHMSRLRRLEEI